MTITKKVKRSDEEFIAKGGEVAADKEKPKYKNVLVRLPAGFVEAMDKEIIMRPYLNRTLIIATALEMYLENKG